MLPARASALVVLVTLLLAGCANVPGVTTPPAADVAAPVSTAPDAVATVVGSTLFLSWGGELVVAAKRPGERELPVGGTPLPFKEHAFTFPPEVRILRAWLNWTDKDARVQLSIVNESARRHCGDLFPAGTGAKCLATYYLPHEGTPDWKAQARMSSYAKDAGGKVAYTLTVALDAAPLPILGSPAPFGAPLPFADSVLVSEDKHSAEPSIAVTPKGIVYVAFPTGPQESVFRSTDGTTFTPVKIHGEPTDPGSEFATGGGDSDVAVHGEDTIYFADQQGGSGETVSSSHDGGKTWFTQPIAAGPPSPSGITNLLPAPVPVGVPTGSVYRADRQWLVTDGDMNVWMGFNSAQGATVVRSVDGGRTWPGRAFLEEDDCFRGNLARAPDGTLYFAGCTEEGPGVGVSTDGGVTFEWRKVATRNGETNTSFLFAAHIFVVATTDAAGNAYIIWSDEAQTPEATKAPEGPSQGLNVWMSSSTDKGASWSLPKKVNQMPGTYVEPWATGGAAGKLAVAYYGTRYVGSPEETIAEWYPIIAVTDDATAQEPAWREASMTSDLVQYGPICMRGSACGNARNLLDFFQIQADNDGRIHATFTDGRAGVSARHSNVLYARSVDALLGGPSVDKNGGPFAESPLSWAVPRA